MQRWGSQRCWSSSLLSEGRGRRRTGGQRTGTNNRPHMYSRTVPRLPLQKSQNVRENPHRRREVTCKLQAERSGLESNWQPFSCEAPTKDASRLIWDCKCSGHTAKVDREAANVRVLPANSKNKKIKKISFHLWDILMETKHLTAFVAQLLCAVPLRPWESTEWTDREDRWRAARSHWGL